MRYLFHAEREPVDEGSTCGHHFASQMMPLSWHNPMRILGRAAALLPGTATDLITQICNIPGPEVGLLISCKRFCFGWGFTCAHQPAERHEMAGLSLSYGEETTLDSLWHVTGHPSQQFRSCVQEPFSQQMTSAFSSHGMPCA